MKVANNFFWQITALGSSVVAETDFTTQDHARPVYDTEYFFKPPNACSFCTKSQKHTVVYFKVCVFKVSLFIYCLDQPYFFSLPCCCNQDT